MPQVAGIPAAIFLLHRKKFNTKSIYCYLGCLSVQSFVEEPGYTEVNPSADTELRCLINEKGGDCLWQKDGKVKKSKC